MPSIVLWGAPILAAVIVLVVVVGYIRRRRSAPPGASSVFPPSEQSGGGLQVRLLEDRDVAHDARIAALRGEVTSLRREAAYAAQRGLDRRAERLRALVTEREEELARYETGDTDQGR